MKNRSTGETGETSQPKSGDVKRQKLEQKAFEAGRYEIPELKALIRGAIGYLETLEVYGVTPEQKQQLAMWIIVRLADASRELAIRVEEGFS